MSATTYRETKGWTWPLLQLGYMSVLAYVSGLTNVPDLDVVRQQC